MYRNRNRFYDIIEKIAGSRHFLKIMLTMTVFLIIVSWNGVCSGPEIESTKQKHTLVIYKIINTPDIRWKFEYHTVSQIIMSSEIYAMGDTLSYTTRSVKRQTLRLKEENIKLKAELSQRDKNWETIQTGIIKILKQYN